MKTRILVVEDDPIIAETTRIYLQTLGYEITDIAKNYHDALKALEKEIPNVVLLDIVIQGKKNGIDLAHTIRERDYPVPIIYTTSHADRSIVEKAKHTRPNGYLVKPIEKDDLFSAIEVALFNFPIFREKEETKEAQQEQKRVSQSLFETKEQEEENDIQNGKYSHSALNEYQRNYLKKSLKELFETKKPYTNKNLRIRDIALELNTNKTYLSQIINDEFQMSFYNFINQYRVEEVKRLLSENTFFTIQEIAYKAGFKSVSSFNIAFKKFTGLNPSIYRNQLLKEKADKEDAKKAARKEEKKD